jgi:hypothetical protein
MQHCICFEKVSKIFKCTISKQILIRLYRIVKSSLSDKLDTQDNVQFYPRLPKMNDCGIISLPICQKSLGIDSENYLWSKLSNDYSDDFPMLIDRSNFNRWRRRLQMFVH